MFTFPAGDGSGRGWGHLPSQKPVQQQVSDNELITALNQKNREKVEELIKTRKLLSTSTLWKTCTQYKKLIPLVAKNYSHQVIDILLEVPLINMQEQEKPYIQLLKELQNYPESIEASQKEQLLERIQQLGMKKSSFPFLKTYKRHGSGDLPQGKRLRSHKTKVDPKSRSIESWSLRMMQRLIREIGSGKVDALKKYLAGGQPAEFRTEDGRSLIGIACEAGNVEAVQLLLHGGVAVNEPDSSQLTPLGQAIKKNNEEVIRCLIENGADVNVPLGDEFEGRCAIHEFASRGDVQLLQLALARGGDINKRDFCVMTPLMHAAKMGQLENVQVLIEMGADLNCQDTDCMSFLHYLAQSNKATSHILELAMARGVNSNIRDGLGMTPLLTAAKNGAAASVEALLLHGVDITCRGNGGKTFLHCLAEGDIVNKTFVEKAQQNNIDINDLGSEMTPLQAAAQAGKITAVRNLLKLGAEPYRCTRSHTFLCCLAKGGIIDEELMMLCKNDLNTVTRDGTPLFCAAQYEREESVHILRKHGALCTPAGRLDYTFLHMLAMGGIANKELVDWCLENGMHIDDQAFLRKTPLSLAALRGKESMVCLLLNEYNALQYKANVMNTELGETFLHDLAAGGIATPEFIRAGLQAGISINAQDKSGRTPILVAAYKGSVESVEAFRNAYVSGSEHSTLTLIDNMGSTLLHHLAAGGIATADLVAWAVANGNEINARNCEGVTPLMVAAEQGDINMIRNLTLAGAEWDLVDNLGRTILHFLIASGHVTWSVFRWMMQKSQAVDRADTSGYTPLMYATIRGDERGMRALFDSSDVAKLDNHNNTFLHHLLLGPQVIRINAVLDLVERAMKKLDVNARNNEGCTPLLLAAKLSSDAGKEAQLEKYITTLLEKGADPNIRDSQERIFLHYLAEGRIMSEVLLALAARKGADIRAADAAGNTAIGSLIARKKGSLAKTLYINTAESSEERHTYAQIADILIPVEEAPNETILRIRGMTEQLQNLCTLQISPLDLAFMTGDRMLLQAVCRQLTPEQCVQGVKILLEKHSGKHCQERRSIIMDTFFGINLGHMRIGNVVAYMRIPEIPLRDVGSLVEILQSEEVRNGFQPMTVNSITFNSLESLQEGLQAFLRRVSDEEPFSGTPAAGTEALKEYYHAIKIALTHLIHNLEKEPKDPKKILGVCAELASVRNLCGGPYYERPHTLYRQYCVGISPTFENKIYSLLATRRDLAVDAMIASENYVNKYQSVHAAGYIKKQIGYDMQLSDALLYEQFDDVYARVGFVNSMLPHKEYLAGRFFAYYRPSEVLDWMIMNIDKPSGFAGEFAAWGIRNLKKEMQQVIPDIKPMYELKGKMGALIEDLQKKLFSSEPNQKEIEKIKAQILELAGEDYEPTRYASASTMIKSDIRGKIMQEFLDNNGIPKPFALVMMLCKLQVITLRT